MKKQNMITTIIIALLIVALILFIQQSNLLQLSPREDEATIGPVQLPSTAEERYLIQLEHNPQTNSYKLDKITKRIAYPIETSGAYSIELRDSINRLLGTASFDKPQPTIVEGDLAQNIPGYIDIIDNKVVLTIPAFEDAEYAKVPVPEGRLGRLLGRTSIIDLGYINPTTDDGNCEQPYENYLSSSDCPSGSLDGMCDGVEDNICDLDCLSEFIPPPDYQESDVDCANLPTQNCGIDLNYCYQDSSFKCVFDNTGTPWAKLEQKCVNGCQDGQCVGPREITKITPTPPCKSSLDCVVDIENSIGPEPWSCNCGSCYKEQQNPEQCCYAQ